MKKISVLIFSFAVGLVLPLAAQVKISDKAVPGTVDEHAILHLDSEDKGILPPKVELVALDDPAPLSTGTLATGMLVYNTASNPSAGYYYWDGSNWIKLGGASRAMVH